MSEPKSCAAGTVAWADGGRVVAVWVERAERDPGPAWLTGAAMVGLLVAAALAVFGMPPVDLHSPLHAMGIMDPLCGMTRGTAATMRGDLGETWWYNPASPLVIAAGLVLVVRGVAGRVTGRWVRVRLRVTPLVVAVAGVALVMLEVNQQLHAARLR